MTMNLHNLAEEIASRVNCYDIAEWAEQLAAALAIPPQQLLPETPGQRHVPALGKKGLELVLSHRQAGHQSKADPQGWILLDARFFPQDNAIYGRWYPALPWGLDAAWETPLTAQEKLGDDYSGGSARDVATGDRRVTYFLSDARAVELAFGPHMQGLECIYVSRLGAPLPEDYFAESKK